MLYKSINKYQKWWVYIENKSKHNIWLAIFLFDIKRYYIRHLDNRLYWAWWSCLFELSVNLIDPNILPHILSCPFSKICTLSLFSQLWDLSSLMIHFLLISFKYALFIFVSNFTNCWLIFNTKISYVVLIVAIFRIWVLSSVMVHFYLLQGRLRVIFLRKLYRKFLLFPQRLFYL